MKLLVTGGAGFIGSHIVDALVAGKHEVVVLDNLSSGHKENLAQVWDQITFIEGDVRDADICQRACVECDGIFHEAALVSVADSVDRPRDCHDINLTGMLNVLEAARTHNVKRVVFASSAAIYGDNPELPKHEGMLPEPMSPYALAKITGEYYLRVYAELYGLECVALRYFNVFGPRQDPSSPYSGVISIFSTRVKQGLSITFYGDGEQTRDFVNVKDVVSANLLAMTVNLPRSDTGDQKSDTRGQISGVSSSSPSTINHPLSTGNFVAFNVATGHKHSLLDLLDTLEDIAGNRIERRFSEARAGDIRHSLARSDKLQAVGWSPSVGFKEGLSALLESKSANG